jgi:hypothetical protein
MLMIPNIKLNNADFRNAALIMPSDQESANEIFEFMRMMLKPETP